MNAHFIEGAQMFLMIYKANYDTPLLYLKVTKNVAFAQCSYIYCWKAYLISFHHIFFF